MIEVTTMVRSTSRAELENRVAELAALTAQDYRELGLQEPSLVAFDNTRAALDGLAAVAGYTRVMPLAKGGGLRVRVETEYRGRTLALVDFSNDGTVWNYLDPFGAPVQVTRADARAVLAAPA